MDSRLFDYDIIIQGGQSNAEGFGAGAIDNEYIPNENVYFLEAEKTVEHLPERVIVEYANKDFDISIAKGREANGNKIVDFSLFFARKYIESGFLKEGRKLLIIRAAVGGTGFKKGNWGMQDLLYKKMLEMRALFYSIYNAPCDKIVIENPTYMKIAELPKHTQVIQPWQFGEPWTKRTCLWVKGVNPLEPTNIIDPVMGPWVNSGSTYRRYGESNGKSKSIDRSKTFKGIAEAMAEQWG